MFQSCCALDDRKDWMLDAEFLLMNIYVAVKSPYWCIFVLRSNECQKIVMRLIAFDIY